MEFLKEVLGDKYSEFEEAVNAYNEKAENKEKQIKLADLGQGNYVAKNKYDSVVVERDQYKEQLDTATETLKGFEGVDVDNLKDELATLTSNMENQRTEYEEKIAGMKFDSSIEKALTDAKVKNVKAAMRTVKRVEISAEFYSYPQKYVLGLSEDAEFDTKAVNISGMWSITQDENGNAPTVGQFTQQSMSPYTEQLKMFASLFAAETGLTVDDLGFVSDNPSSAEAIKSLHENLRLAGRKAQRTLGSGFLNAGYLAACIRDDYPYPRNQIYLTKPMWEPIFEPDAAMLSSIGDGVVKINQSVPG